ncbi:hypothetical protein [Streptomyces sp. NPDC059008]|uniref:hypothetical protein n=1 Tax=Streptomyces sp. NPDC059008 TaxID=3346693 RepID=UPI0036B6B932
MCSTPAVDRGKTRPFVGTSTAVSVPGCSSRTDPTQCGDPGRIVIPQPREAPDVKKKRKRLEKEIAKVTGALDRAAEAFALGDIPRDSYLRTRGKFDGQRAEKQKELDALPDDEAPQLGPLPYREKMQGLLDEWDTIGVESKRVTLASIVRRVEIAPNKTVNVVPVRAPADEPDTAASIQSA